MSPALQPNPAVIVTDLEEEMVLLHPQTREMFSLNASGRLVWQHIVEGQERVVEQMVQTFAVDQARAKADVLALVEALKSRGLITEQAVP